ncbi:MAG TPA: hypothetical protein VFU13_20260 [Steroidobacteraceae bacterium]|nr:hypothetical protein [Steroidobacteraceae bacterium]
MSGLLARLAGQALGAKAAAAKGARVRPAMSVHAQVPVVMDEQPQVSVPASAPIPDGERSTTQVLPSLTTDDETPLRQTRRAPATAAGQPHKSSQRASVISALHDPIADEPTVKPASMPRAITTTHSEAPQFARPLEPVPSRLLDEAEPAAPRISPAIAPVRAQAPLSLRPDPSTPNAGSTEVHVHIGRIEVTAAHEPVPARKKSAPPARQSVPLADYLARRRPS